jgi:hypothetical protein
MKLQVQVEKRSAERLSLAPATVTLRAGPGRAASALVLVRDSQDQPVAIEAVEIPSGAAGVSSRFPTAATSPAAVRIIADPSKGAVPDKTVIQIKVKEPIARTLTLTVWNSVP